MLDQLSVLLFGANHVRNIHDFSDDITPAVWQVTYSVEL